MKIAATILFMLLPAQAMAITPSDQAATTLLPHSVPSTGINMTAVLQGENGLPIKDQYVRESNDAACDHCPNLTLGNAISHALLYSYPDEKDLPWDQKYARYDLASKVRNNAIVVLSSTEIVTIKMLLNKMYNALVVGDAVQLLEPSISPPTVAIPK